MLGVVCMGGCWEQREHQRLVQLAVRAVLVSTVVAVPVQSFTFPHQLQGMQHHSTPWAMCSSDA